MNRFLFLGLVLCVSGLLFAQNEDVRSNVKPPVYGKVADQAVYDGQVQFQNVQADYTYAYENPADKTAQEAYSTSNIVKCEKGFTYSRSYNRIIFSCADPKDSVSCNTVDNEHQDLDWTRINIDFKITAVSKSGVGKDDFICFIEEMVKL